MSRIQDKIYSPFFLEDKHASQPIYDFRQQTLQHFDALYKLATYLTRGSHLADDLVQETYLRAFRFEHQFRPDTHMRAWLFQIMRNTFSTFYTKGKREIPDDGVYNTNVTPMFTSESIVDQQVNDYGLEEHLSKAIESVPEKYRTTLLLSAVQDLPLEEIALITGVPLGTVKSRISRAKDILYVILKPYYLKPEGSENGYNGNGNRPKIRKYLNPIDIQRIIEAHAKYGYATRAAKYIPHSTSKILAIWRLNKLPIQESRRPKLKEKI